MSRYELATGKLRIEFLGNQATPHAYWLANNQQKNNHVKFTSELFEGLGTESGAEVGWGKSIF